MGSETLKVQALSETSCNRWALECAEPHRSKQGMEELFPLHYSNVAARGCILS